MLEGLMQHDYPLTLQHVLERMRSMNGDARGRDAHGRRDDARDVRRGRRARRPAGAALCASSGSSRATAWRRSPGTASTTSRSTSPCRAWAPCCTR